MKIKHFHNFSFLHRFLLVRAIKIDKVLSPHCKGGKKLTIVNLDKNCLQMLAMSSICR